MITKENVREMLPMTRLNEIIMTEMYNYGFTERQLEYFYHGTPYAYNAIATYALKLKFDFEQAEYMRDYMHLSELYAEWMQEFYTLMSKAETSEQKNLAYLALGKALNVKFDLEKRASHYALFSQFHECKHTGI